MPRYTDMRSSKHCWSQISFAKCIHKFRILPVADPHSSYLQKELALLAANKAHFL